MHAFVRLRAPAGVVTLVPGDIVGRTSGAALVLDDGRISEAHALVSLRGAELRLLALRGRFSVDGTPSTNSVLSAGQTLRFAPGVEVHVEAVVLPDRLPALRGPGLPAIVLHGSASVFVGPPPRVVPRHDGGADAWLWLAGDRWRLSISGEPPRGVALGDGFVVSGTRFELVLLDVQHAGTRGTELSDSDVPLRIVADVDAVQLHRAGEPPVLIGGIAARIIGFLAQAECAVEWATVASTIWAAESDRNALRKRFDVALVRLRARLRAARVRADLVSTNGAGLVELVRYPGDQVVLPP